VSNLKLTALAVVILAETLLVSALVLMAFRNRSLRRENKRVSFSSMILKRVEPAG
jgi:hypothetical protein